MSFICPRCGAPALEIEGSLELPADATWDENNVQVTACRACQFRGAAIYRESRRGALDSECYWHTGIRISAEQYAQLAVDIAACPDHANRLCGCAAHLKMGREGWLDGLEGELFEMRLAG